MTRLQLIERQLKRIRQKQVKLEKKSSRYSWYRLASIIIAIIISILALYYTSNTLATISILIVLTVFGSITFFHSRVRAAIDRYERLFYIYELNRNRLNLNWNKLPSSEYNADLNHPYAFDLDLYGKNSLLQLIDQSVSENSFKLILKWLLTPNLDHHEIVQRQHSIKELKKHTAFRNRLYLLNLDMKNPVKKMKTDGLLNWFAENKIHISVLKITILFILGSTTVFLFFMHQYGLIQAYWQYPFTVYVILYLLGGSKIGAIFESIFLIPIYF